MSDGLSIRIYDGRMAVHSVEVPGPLELGRQQPDEPCPYALTSLTGNAHRLILARLDEDTVSRRHLRIEPCDEGRVRLDNLSLKLPVFLEGGSQLAPQSQLEAALPLRVQLGDKTVLVDRLATAGVMLTGLQQRTLIPGQLRFSDSRVRRVAAAATQGVDAEAMVHWLQTVVNVLYSAAGSRDFFQQAAQAAVHLVGLDACMVLMREATAWKPVASYAARPDAKGRAREPSRYILNRLVDEKRTIWQQSNPAANIAASLMAVEAVVAAPILNSAGAVIGALYADRGHGSLAAGPSTITKLEAMLIELLAGSVAAGLMRLAQEEAAIAARVKFGQFFTPELSRHLESDPDLLNGRETEVTVLFADIRGFSRIAERLGPARTVDWIRDSLGVLSECVLDHGGVLVDYVGDEIAAMWGAPQAQEDHAVRACRAALEMLNRLPQLDERWQKVLGERLEIGVGINTGIAQVGNIGSERKFKYGPLGTTVNVGSRVQGVTKYLKANLLITAATRAKLPQGYVTRRIGLAKLVNIAEPVELYELVVRPDERFAAISGSYEAALAKFEQRNWREAARILGQLLAEAPDDGPSVVLMSRVVAALIDEPKTVAAVWDVPGK